MQVKRTLAVAVSALSLAATGLLGFTSTAQADARIGKSQCTPDMQFCLFSKKNYQGIYWDSWTGNGCENVRSVGPESINNKASSMSNGSDRRVRLYDRANCAGSAGYSARPDSDDSDLSNNGFDNKATSLKS